MGFEDLLELAREPSSEKRSALLRRVTDLFYDGVSDRNVSENELFEEIVLRVLQDVDLDGRAGLAQTIADRPNVSRRIVLTLAEDDIAVAACVLERSPVLDDPALVRLAGAGSDPHLQAISRRMTLSEIVTDALLKRGGSIVRRLLAANAGARFSSRGFGVLVGAAADDESLKYDLATRHDLPEEAVEALSRLLSHKLRQTLSAMGLNSTDSLAPSVLETLHLRLSSTLDERDREGREISAVIRDIASGAATIDKEIQPLARADRAFDIAQIVSELANVDHATVMKAITGANEEPLIVLFRSLDATWETFESVLQLKAKRQRRPYVKLLSLARTYQEMDRATAQRVMRFLQIRRTSESRAA
jgi:uncharacterized protein (DUF2336 family)